MINQLSKLNTFLKTFSIHYNQQKLKNIKSIKKLNSVNPQRDTRKKLYKQSFIFCIFQE